MTFLWQNRESSMIDGKTKSQLRKQMIQQRLALPAYLWQEKSEIICQKLGNLPEFRKARTILAYFSFRQEPDLSPLFSFSNSTWGFSRSVGESLSWHSWQSGEPLEKNSYGIFEPLATAPTIFPEEVDLILIPGVACDRRGYRLGYGGGFFDRMLASPVWATIPTIGIVFDFAFLDELPVEPWDQPLSGICTEERFLTFQIAR